MRLNASVQSPMAQVISSHLRFLCIDCRDTISVQALLNYVTAEGGQPQAPPFQGGERLTIVIQQNLTKKHHNFD